MKLSMNIIYIKQNKVSKRLVACLTKLKSVSITKLLVTVKRQLKYYSGSNYTIPQF
jgi:hypothetical protein